MLQKLWFWPGLEICVWGYKPYFSEPWLWQLLAWMCTSIFLESLSSLPLFHLLMHWFLSFSWPLIFPLLHNWKHFFSHPLNDSVPKGSHLCTFLYILTLCRKCQPCWWHEKGQVTPRPRAPASVLLPLFVLYFQLSKGIFTSNSTSAEHPFSYFLLVSCVHMAAQDRSLRVCWASSQPKTRSSWPLLSPHSHAQVRPSTFFSGAQQLLPHWFSYTQPFPISKFICP